MFPRDKLFSATSAALTLSGEFESPAHADLQASHSARPRSFSMHKHIWIAAAARPVRRYPK
jgi:hypothetical protein